jgi:hypothetical protein
VWDVKYNSKPIYGSIKGISFDYLQAKEYKVKD